VAAVRAYCFKLNAYLASTAVSGNSWFVTVQVF
jgi:hypothetical protein